MYVYLDLLHSAELGGWKDAWKAQSPGHKKKHAKEIKHRKKIAI